MGIRTFWKAHRWIRRLTISGVVLLILFTVTGFFIVPAVARSVGQSQLSRLLHRQVTIDEVRLNPFALSATVRGLRIRDRDGARDLFALKEAYVNVQLASVWKRALVLQQLHIVEPAISVVRTAPDRYNFSDIIDEQAAQPAAPPPPPPPAAQPARFSLSNIELVNGRIELDDRPKAKQHAITGLNISVPFISNFPYLVETFVLPAFSANINGTQLAISGRTKPFTDSLESSIDVNLTKVDLPYYFAYVPVKLRLAVRSALLDTRLKVTFIQYRNRAPRVDVSGTVALSALDVTDDQGAPLVKLPLLDIAIASSDLLSNKLSIEHVRLASLEAHVRRGKNGAMQLANLVDSGPPPGKGQPAPAKAEKARPAAPAKGSEPPTTPWLVEVGKIDLDGARVVYADDANPRPIRITLDPLNLSLHRFTTAKGGEAEVTLAATTDAKESLAIAGRLALAPFNFKGTVDAKGLPAARYTPYYGAFLLFDVRQGVLDVSSPVELGLKAGPFALVVDGAKVDLRELQLRKRGEQTDFFRLPELSVRDGKYDLGKGELILGEVTTAGARIRLDHPGKDKPWSFATLLAGASPESGGRTTTPATAPTPRPKAASEARDPAERPFLFRVGKLDLKGWVVRVEDRGLRNPATITLDRLSVRLDGFSTEHGRQARVSLQMQVNQSGSVGVTGAFGLDPLQANLQVQLKTIPILPVQPYFEDQVALLLTSGHLSVNGKLTLTPGAGGPGIGYAGEVSLGNLVAVERNGAEELARVGELRVSGIDLVLDPFKLNVAEILLADYAAHLVIKPDGSINAAALAGPADGAGKSDAKSAAAAPAPALPPSPAAAPPPAQPSPAVRVAAVVLRGGTIHVTDRSISPAFSTALTDFGGRISGLSFNQAETALVVLKGRLGDGPLEISGRINPLAQKKHVDLTIKLDDLDLSAMTPYSGKYAGYAVEKGQLALNLKYLIEGRQLDATNHVRLDQFTFGRSVESKDATNLPVRLAVSLLKDRQGVIKIDLPVSGSLDDPKFSVWGVVWMVLKNLLVKAATSPFALIGSLFGGGEELSWVEFEPGRAELPAAARAKLETLNKALHEHPALRLEVEGHADPDRDLLALRRLELERRVKAQKLKEVVAGGTDANQVGPVSPAEYPKYLKLAYAAEKIDKPKNAFGMVKDIPASEMERLMLAAIVATDGDLRLLARQRAQAAREQILREKNVQTERVFLVEPKSLRPAHKDKVRDSRVDFRLQ
jgi:uncharacterized protein involved in outer membrane biogenesis